MAKKIDLVKPKLTLGELGIVSVLSQLLQHQPETLLMFSLSLGIHKDVVEVEEDKDIKPLLEKNSSWCYNYALEAIINCIIIIPGSLLMFICLCYNCNGLCGGLPSSMLTASVGKPICRCGV